MFCFHRHKDSTYHAWIRRSMHIYSLEKNAKMMWFGWVAHGFTLIVMSTSFKILSVLSEEMHLVLQNVLYLILSKVLLFYEKIGTRQKVTNFFFTFTKEVNMIPFVCEFPWCQAFVLSYHWNTYYIPHKIVQESIVSYHERCLVF